MIHEFTPEEIARATASYRGQGAVGSNAVTPRAVAAIATPEDRILDFGCGPFRHHVEAVRQKGLRNTIGLDFALGNSRDTILRRSLQKPFTIVYLSNVLNIQSSADMLRRTLEEARSVLAPDGLLIANYPASPRYAGLSQPFVRARVSPPGWYITNLPGRIVGNNTVWAACKNEQTLAARCGLLL